MRIEGFNRKHEGGSVLILGNGPSCKMADLSVLDYSKLSPRFLVIGLNQAWRLVARKAYFCLCMGDPVQYAMWDGANPPGYIYGGVPRPTVFTTESGPEYAIRLQGLHNDPEHPKRFSIDLTQGVYLNNTIASFGFQLAAWMLGERGMIYTLGLDCDGPQFDGSPMPPGTFENQRETLGYIAGFLGAARPGIQIYDLSPVSKQRVFERKKFEEVFG